MTVSEIAKRINVTTQYVRELIRNGILVGERVGNQWLCSCTDLDKFVKRNRININPIDHPASTSPQEPIALSFFTGAMGLDIGMEQAGIKAVLACEFNKACRMTINANRSEMALIGDINKYSSNQILEMAGLSQNAHIDIVFGGPPCQAFSTAGARRGFNDERGNVFLTFLSRISELKPTYVVIENVRGLLSAEYPYGKLKKPIKGGALKIVLDRLRQIGYAVSFNLYNAAYFGAPQIRERVVIVAKRGSKKVPYLTPTNSDRPADNLPTFVTFKQAVKDVEKLVQHHIDFPEKRLKFYRMLKEGQYWKDLPKECQREALGHSFDLGGGKTGFYRRLAWDKPSPTLVTNPTMPATDLCHPSEDRPLSIEEYKAIQGFPSDWIICGNILDQYRQIGNAVPIRLGLAIGKTIMNDLNGIDACVPNRFSYSRYVKTNEIEWEDDFERRYNLELEKTNPEDN